MRHPLALATVLALVAARRRATLRFRVRAGRRAVRGARVSLAGRSAITDRLGRAAMTMRLGRTGRRAVVARARGFRAGRTTVRVRRAASFTG